MQPSANSLIEFWLPNAGASTLSFDQLTAPLVMSFLYFKPEEVADKLKKDYGSSLSGDRFVRRDEFQQDNLTEDGRSLLTWLFTGKVTGFREEHRWLEPVDTIAVLCYGADYDLFRQEWPADLQASLDEYYGPFRCNTFLPSGPVSEDFDCQILGAVGVKYIYSPVQCGRLYGLGSEHPFVALFAELFAKRGTCSDRLRAKLDELVSESEWRDLLCRYDAMHQELRAAYFHSRVTRKHLIVTNHW